MQFALPFVVLAVAVGVAGYLSSSPAWRAKRARLPGVIRRRRRWAWVAIPLVVVIIMPPWWWLAPFAAMLAGGIVGLMWALEKRLIARVTRAEFRVCPECGYSLEGADESGRCPECGREFDRAKLKSEWLDHLNV